jgi:hypothetical protein
MKRIAIQSSIIRSIGYHRAEFVLEVEFVKGSIYQYFEVYPDEVISLLFADSIGSYFMRNISKQYKYEKVS